MVLALHCGLQLANFEFMTVGMIFDYIDEYMEMQSGGETEEIEAGQNEFDSF